METNVLDDDAGFDTIHSGASVGRSVYDIARDYIACGYSVIPIAGDGTKAPDARLLPRTPGKEGRLRASWEPFQHQQATPRQLSAWFDSGLAKSAGTGLALVHGAISGHSECLDIESASAWKEFAQNCKQGGFDDIARLCPRVKTPSGGVHLYYRCEEPVQGNQKLAMVQQFATNGDREDALAVESYEPDAIEVLRRAGWRQDGSASQYTLDGEWYKVKTLIETRGEGGYTIACGSPARCHPAGAPYRLMNGSKGFDSVPVLSAAQRDALLAMARICNRWVEPEKVVRASTTRTYAPGEQGERPGDEYNARQTNEDVLRLLLEYGWGIERETPDGYQLTRPGKQRGVSATLGYCGPGIFYPFTSSAHPFGSNHAYTPYAVLCLLRYGGDWSEGAKNLAKEGYGKQERPSTVPAPAPAPPPQPLPDESLEVAEGLARRAVVPSWLKDKQPQAKVPLPDTEPKGSEPTEETEEQQVARLTLEEQEKLVVACHKAWLAKELPQTLGEGEEPVQLAPGVTTDNPALAWKRNYSHYLLLEKQHGAQWHTGRNTAGGRPTDGPVVWSNLWAVAWWWHIRNLPEE